ncbi:GD22132 [Drosophila simulans]|uniref:GD22132 n=1 Tax=Drosophila simulans TaxID=7240 RepID=B4Q3P9_DROSI|nr:GD22132 [Drosophila simulans]
MGRVSQSERPLWRALRLVRVVVPAKWLRDMADVWAVASQKGNDLGRRSDGEVSQAQIAQRATPHLVLVLVFAFASVSSIFSRLRTKRYLDIRSATNRLINTSQRLLMTLTKCPAIVQN